MASDSNSITKMDDSKVEEAMSEERLVISEEENRRIVRKTDKYVLSILVWVYFLQILDKSVLGYGSLFGLQADTKLKGTQYSWAGSMAPIAQLIWLPFSSWLIVKVPPRILMSTLVLGWGTAQTCMAATDNFAGLATARFFLGLFEAACLPLFGVLTSQWYRRREQPLRVAAWYGTNGLATIIGSALSYGLGKIPSNSLKSWQIIFLFVGLVTVCTAPVVYWFLDNNVAEARFLTEHERALAIERLRSNNTGLVTNEFKWSHVKEIFLDPKSYMFFFMALLLNVGAAVSNVFGPLILSGLGFDKYKTSLLNIPFGVVQLLIILISSYAAHKARMKGLILAILMFPVVAGLATLYSLPRSSSYVAPNLVAYYLMACLFGANPLFVTWLIANTGGTTKKSVLMVIFNIGISAGNIVGPLLFNARDAPAYKPGLRATLGMFCALVAVILANWMLLVYLNKANERSRVAEGKPAKLVDYSMTKTFGAEGENVQVQSDQDDDVTDRKNNEFIYVY
ncbi:MFS-type transporter-like protein 41 [Elsinoe fawcettii]|nr:MFS-type transporter-like protein 41 [Elsinoe fawcettii]